MPNSNYRIVYDGIEYETTYFHGRRVSDLQMRVLEGTEPPADIEIQLAGDGDAPMLTLHVGPGHSIDVIPVEVYRPDQA